MKELLEVTAVGHEEEATEEPLWRQAKLLEGTAVGREEEASEEATREALWRHLLAL